MRTRARAMLSPLRKGARRVMRRLGYSAATTGDIDAYDYVFVITYGRSGSTLLMGLLNAIPGYRIRGENYNALYRLYQADAAIARACDQFSGSDHDDPRSAWYGTPRVRPHLFRAGLVASFVHNILRPQAGDRVLGFKEIRHTQVHMSDLDRYLDFLRESFPGCRIVFNHRDPAAVAASAWWANVDDAAEKIRKADERLSSFPADARHFHFHYDEIDDGLDNIRALFDFLGEAFDEGAIRAVLGRPYGPYTAMPHAAGEPSAVVP